MEINVCLCTHCWDLRVSDGSVSDNDPLQKGYFMKRHRSLSIAMCALLPTIVMAVDAPAPLHVSAESGNSSLSPTPRSPLGSGDPEILPSQMDAGMQHIQQGRHDPHASLAPPNLDPSMSTNPDVAPPLSEEGRDASPEKRFQGSHGLQ